VLADVVAVDSKWACGTSREVGETLSDGGEEIIATGSADELFLMSFWANRETREWTIVVTDGKNREISCVVLYGTKLKTITSSRVSV
jgi:deoxycytidylate deaminase